MTSVEPDLETGIAPVWHAGFLAMIPMIRHQVHSLFRHLSPEDRDDALAEVTAVAMIDFLDLLKVDPAGSTNPTALVRSAALHVLGGWRACGRESSRDVLSPAAQQRRGFTVGHLKTCYDQERLQTRVRLREHGARGAWEPTPLSNGEGDRSGASLRFAHERSRRRTAENRLHSADLEFQIARQIQQRLFPKAPLVVPGFEIAGLTCPANATGGDYFDYVPMLNEGIGVVIGDVSGHGFGPALLMASTRAYLRAFAQTQSDLGELLSQVNRVLALDMEDSRFVTIVLARFDTLRRSFVYASAGHTTAYVLDPSGRTRMELPSTGLPLGIDSDEGFSASAVIRLQPDELVVLLSDGVTEAVAPDGTAFGSLRAIDIVRVYRNDPAAGIVHNLYHAIRAFCQNTPQLDDITAILVKVKDGDTPAGMEHLQKNGRQRT